MKEWILVLLLPGYKAVAVVMGQDEICCHYAVPVEEMHQSLINLNL